MYRLTIVMGVALLLAALAPRALTQEPENADAKLVGQLKQFAPAKEDPKDNELRKLLKERYNAAVDEVSVRLQRVEGGAETPDELIPAARRVIESGLELSDKPTDQLVLLEKDVALTKLVEKLTKERVDAGVKNFTPADLSKAKYARADAEIRLLRFKEKLKAGTK
jgi:hypothetical protein